MNKLYIIFFAFLLLSGCAQVVAPTGGPRDVTPPKVTAYSPPDKSILFHERKIDITFDEYIQLKDLSKQFIISPPVKYMPIPVVKGKVLEIPLTKDTLLDNTTYTFNFGDAVCDLHEGNPLKNFQYVISTGTYVDSLSVAGTAIDAFTHDPVKEGLVLMYANLDDSTPYKKPPSYCGQTDDNGKYRINNIKNGTYKIIALSKGSGDYLYHPSTQSIGFKNGLLTLNKNDTVNFFLFNEPPLKLEFMKAKAVGQGEIMVIFNKPADSIKITLLNMYTLASYNTLYQYSGTRDTLTYWNNYPGLDSLKFIVSRNNKILDTASIYNIPGHAIKTNTVKKKDVKPVKAPTVLVELNIANNTPYDYHLPFTFKFKQPLSGYELSKIKLTQRKDTIPLKPAEESSFSLSLSPQKDLISDSGYSLTMMPGAFTNFFGYINDTIIAHFTIQEQSYYGTLKLNLSFAKKTHYLVQLLASNNSIYRQDTISKNGSIFYDGLPPALYGIRVIEDDNNNGKWDAGDYMQGIEPEQVYYYPDKINVRSNWDVTQEWKVN